jgi:CrcB protein
MPTAPRPARSSSILSGSRWTILTAIAAGGAAGSLTRHGIVDLLTSRGAEPEVAVIVVNVAGSFLIGALATRSDAPGWPFLAVGFCGGLTTFSTFAVHVATALRASAPVEAGLLVVVTVFGAVGAAVLGHRLGGIVGESAS